MNIQSNQKSNSGQSEEILGDEVKKSRPNIDELLKRISTERKQERKSTQIIVVMAVIGISVVTTVFYQL
jgi:hypothetical protein